MKARLEAAINQALRQALADQKIPPLDVIPAFSLERPRQKEHGDFATNLALQMAKPCRLNPRQLAEIMLPYLQAETSLLHKAEAAGPGFINFHLNPAAWLATLPALLAAGPDYGRSQMGRGRKVMVEFVSANPTGPLHVGHGRGAVLGDMLARLLTITGHEVLTEYYINDAGNQMTTLGRSVLCRALELSGHEVAFPENHYRGDYIRDLAGRWLAEGGREKLAGLSPAQADHLIEPLAAWAGQLILADIKNDLAAFGVSLEHYQSERAIVREGAVEQAFAELQKRGLLYESQGALWFKSTQFGDDKDRVVRRQSGELTYFATDIAYHLHKLKRGYASLVDIWGADHHGYQPRLQAALKALEGQPSPLTVVLVQLVSLLRAGQPVAMSTRAGEFVTLREVVAEVGRDSARFIFLTRRSDTPLDFDLDVAKQKSMDNPVFYVQYAHTRCHSVLVKAKEAGLELPETADLSPLSLEAEIELIRTLAEYPQTIEAAALALEPHRLTYYLHELAGQFHSYYNAHHILYEDPPLTMARLTLTRAVAQVLYNGLALLGVSAPEVM